MNKPFVLAVIVAVGIGLGIMAGMMKDDSASQADWSDIAQPEAVEVTPAPVAANPKDPKPAEQPKPAPAPATEVKPAEVKPKPVAVEPQPQPEPVEEVVEAGNGLSVEDFYTALGDVYMSDTVKQRIAKLWEMMPDETRERMLKEAGRQVKEQIESSISELDRMTDAEFEGLVEKIKMQAEEAKNSKAG